MLWRFSFASTSTLDSLLGRETPPSIEEVMDDTDVLQECKAQNNKLVNFLGREESIKSLLHWVVSGFDELDEQSRQADRACLAKGREDLERYPPYKGDVSATQPQPEKEASSVPLEPAKIAEASAQEEETDLSAGNMGMLQSAAPTGGEDDEAHRARYPSVAAEILTSEVWVIPETILANKEVLLRPFWDAVLPPILESSVDASEDVSGKALFEKGELYRARVEYGTDEDDERDRQREVIRGLWVKVNGNLLAKRTHEMIRFIQAIPNVVSRLVAQIHSPAIQDIIIRLISSEEAGVAGVIQWLAEEKLVSRLTSLLSPQQAPHIHVLVTELLKNIVTLCAPPPFNPLGGNMQEQQSAQGATSGTRDNRMVRELVSEESVRKLVGYMLDPLELSDIDWKGLNGDGKPHPADPFVVQPLPSTASAASSLSSISAILVELIRRNNSDFAEPHLFHTLRNRLINMRMEQGAPLGQMEGGDKEDQDRERMEEAVKGMVEAMGIVHLKSLMDIFCERFERLYQLLLEPRSQKLAASPALAKPLTLERFRIVELYAELLHSSNMSILNRLPGTGPEYSYEGILSGGLAGLEALGEAIDEDRESPSDVAPEGQVTQARELPVSSNASTAASLSGEEMSSDSDDEKMLEDIAEETTPSASPTDSGFVSRVFDREQHEPAISSNANKTDTLETPTAEREASQDVAGEGDAAETNPPSPTADVFGTNQSSAAIPPSRSRESSPAHLSSLAPGERLKRLYLDHRVFSTLIDMFFEYSSNDFLHHVVYDMLQQILNGKLSPGLNRDLLEEMICKARLAERVLEAQRHNDRVSAKGNQPRLPYMGHIILISEELVKFLVRCPSDLLDTVLPFIPQPEWDDFVAGQLSETRARDAQPLAGGKPMISASAAGEGSSSKSEDESSGSDSDDEEPAQLGGFGTFGEPLQRTKATEGFVRRESGDGSDADNDDTGSEEESTDRYWRNTAGLRRHVDSSDEDEDDAEWLRPSDEFGGFSSAPRSGPSDEFDDDEAWGTFSSGGGTTTTNDDPFGDDNFAPLNDTFSPSVQPRASSSSNTPAALERGDPLTPHDWFDREFSSAWGDDDESVPAIVVPDTDETEGEGGGDNEVDVPRTPGSTWSFTGDEGAGEDLPSAISPVIEQQEDNKDDRADDGTRDIADSVSGLGITDVSAPIPINRPTSSAMQEGSSSSSAVSTSPSATTPIPSRSPQAAPIAIPSSPAKTRRPPPPPSPRKRRTSSQSSDTKPHLGTSPNLGISPTDPSLVQATSTEQPLGPGVSEDVEVTDNGMLKREIDGKEVTVPKDEIAMGVAEAVADTHSTGTSL